MSSNRAKYSQNPASEGYDLYPSLSNRLVLSIRSGIPSEIDFGLHRFLIISSERHEEFEFYKWPNLVVSLLELVEAWVSDVTTHASRLEELGLDPRDGSGTELITQEELDTERRATDAMLLMRNACCMGSESNKMRVLEVLARPSMMKGLGGDKGKGKGKGKTSTAGLKNSLLPPRILVSFNTIFGELDEDDLFALSLRSPEIVIYFIEVMHAFLPHLLPRNPPHLSKPDINGNGEGQGQQQHDSLSLQMITPLITSSLPNFFLTCQDLAIICPLMQLFILAPAHISPPLTLLAPKLLPFLLLTPTNPAMNTLSPFNRGLLLFTLDLLYELTSSQTSALSLLALPSISNWLKVLLALLNWNATPQPRSWAAPDVQGKIVPLPKSIGMRQGMVISPLGGQLQGYQPVVDDEGSPMAVEHLGLGPLIAMSPQRREMIRLMNEPERSLTWIRDVFTYHPESSITQVTFWNTYKDFMEEGRPTSTGRVPPANLIAGDVIKSATTAFPGCTAVVLSQDPATGRPFERPKFVIQGLKFRRMAGRRETFKCRWSDCLNPPETLNPTELLHHLLNSHAPPTTGPTSHCKWGSCIATDCTKSHLLTHIPPPLDHTREAGHQHVIVHPMTPYSQLSSSHLTNRYPPPLTVEAPLHYTGQTTPTDLRKLPIGEGFLAALILRNLARALKVEIAQAEGEDGGLGTVGRKKRQLETGEAFGLPAPPGYAEAMFGSDATVSLTALERDRAKTAFLVTVEEKALQVIQDGGALASVLSTVVGF